MFTFKHFFLLNFHCLTYSAPVQSWSNSLGWAKFCVLAEISGFLFAFGHFNADLSLQQDGDHLINVFMDPRILAFSFFFHFNLFPMPEIILSLHLNLCKVHIKKQREQAGKWNLFARTKEGVADVDHFSCRNFFLHRFHFLNNRIQRKYLPELRFKSPGSDSTHAPEGCAWGCWQRIRSDDKMPYFCWILGKPLISKTFQALNQRLYHT